MSAALRRTAALLAASLALLGVWAASASAAEEFDKFAVESVSASLTDQQAPARARQAGAHADMTVAVKLTSQGDTPYARARDIEIELPPGIIGNPQAIERCTPDQLGNGPEDSACPFASQVGTTQVRVIKPTSGLFNEPVYNMAPPKGSDIVARLGFIAVGWPAFINIRVDPADFGLIATVEGIPSASGLSEATTTIWGVPSAPVHDAERITPEEAKTGGAPAGGRSVNPGGPFLSNPTDCSLAREVRVTARSYQLPDQPSTMSAAFPEITGCGNLNFAPIFTTAPTNPEAAAPTGVDTKLSIPQDESPQGLATSTLKSARVTLPAGFAINPAAADGLQACSAEQVGYGRNVAAACPDAAKIGSLEADVPALEEPLHGAVYQRSPEPGHLFGFWVVADEQGVHLKLPAQIEPNPLTGQVTVVLDHIAGLAGLPQVPVAHLELNVFGGPRAPLSTPAGCGTYLTEFSFAPWSGRPAAQGSTPMQITAGCGKGGFAPHIEAGSLSPKGGHYSPFAFTLTRQDGESNPQTIALHLPQGVLAKLAGVPLCSDADAATGACPAASRLGSLTAASGVGGAPLWIPQPGKAPTAAYLAGAYKGAPYSIVSVVPAQAGPFDLGVVVNRAGIYVNPDTAQARVVTDPLPQFLEGVPLSYRTVHVLVDRPNFTLNPTSCRPKQTVATVTASDGRVAEASDGFQATHCAQLPYTPQLRLVFKGKMKRTGNPAVRATLRQKPGQANNAGATVLLPKSEFIDNSHISNPCTRVEFAAESCPAKSELGTVVARTPLLDHPLRGKIYFRSNGGERELPDLVADLRGQLRVILVGYIDSVKGRVRTRFLGIPDAPVSSFTMKLFGGQRGLIENSRNLCASKPRVEIHLDAQNGRSSDTNPRIGLPCGKHPKK
ncbi:MAG TPA: hypothetical protein VGW80_09940 [Solirubrobacterales bacterium]|jgi:hypothetical protein|nr:hypothetical protein [Solirubrobacterales bacterium]